MKNENLKTFISKINRGYKLEELYNKEESKIQQVEFIKSELKQNKKDLYFNFVLSLVAFILIYLIIFYT